VRLSARASLLAAAILLLLAPIAGAWLRWGGLPPGFVFPADRGLAKASFDPIVYALLWIGPLLFAAAVVAPSRFDFRPATPGVEAPTRTRLPPWFRLGAVVALVGWTLLWTQPPGLESVGRYVFSPQWWGFILALDGIVYARTGGRSLLATRPWTLLSMALTSCVAWYLYEYLNAFFLEQWYYPVRGVFSHAGYVLAYSVAYTTITPAVLEWYLLLRSFPALAQRFSHGPVVPRRRHFAWIAALAGLALTFAAAIWNDQLFFAIWFGPDLLLAGALAMLGVWTPLTPLSRGDWSRVVLPALASMCNGVVWEMWNHWSAPRNPHYWLYDVPYAGVGKVFGMPIIGFFGYAPFGVSVWLTWIFCATVLGLDPAFEDPDLTSPRTAP
jgi:hypothetical protein